MAAMDQPTVDGVNTYVVSKFARRAGLKVAVAGLGVTSSSQAMTRFEESATRDAP